MTSPFPLRHPVQFEQPTKHRKHERHRMTRTILAVALGNSNGELQLLQSACDWTSSEGNFDKGLDRKQVSRTHAEVQE